MEVGLGGTAAAAAVLANSRTKEALGVAGLKQQDQAAQATVAVVDEAAKGNVTETLGQNANVIA